MYIECLDAESVVRALPALSALLQEVVHAGASLGFLPPVGEQNARSYWCSVAQAVAGGTRILLVAKTGEKGSIAGAAQMELAQQQNARHRAEVMKVMVHPSARRRGVGSALLAAVEREALARTRSLLILDTERGSVAEPMYRSLGYVEVGIIPGYARGADGELHDTVYFFKVLEGPTVSKVDHTQRDAGR